jgi:hypothetical protein
VAKQRNSKIHALRPMRGAFVAVSLPAGRAARKSCSGQFIVGHRFLSVIVGVDLESW